MSLPLPEQPSRNRSASNGDSGLPQHEHKRPRLSEGPGPSERATLTISTETSGSLSSNNPVSISSLSREHQNSHSALVSPPQSPLPTTEPPDATSPQSKVTINTRPISSHSSTNHVQPGNLQNKMHSASASALNQSQPEHPTSPITNNHPDTISISSGESDSGSGSPLIQVAAPEDIDQDPAETQWEPLTISDPSYQAPIRSGYVQNTFPFTTQTTRAHHVIVTIAKFFIEGDLTRDDMFEKIQIWLVDFSDRATNLDYNFFEEDRDFWSKLPTLTSSLLKRKVNLPTGFDVDDLVHYFTAYARIAMMILDTDIRKLQSYTDVTDPKHIVAPRCIAYVTQLYWIITTDGIPLYDNLHESLNINPKLVTDAIVDRLILIHPDRHVRSFIALFQLMADQFSKRPGLVDTAFNIVHHSGLIMSILAARINPSADSDCARDDYVKLLSASSDFLQSIDAVLDRAISKQQPWLNIESCEKTIKVVGGFVETLAICFPHLTIDLVSAANVQTGDFRDSELTSIAALAWKFVTLQKIIKKGRMEVRVACVQLMASELIETYNAYIRPAQKPTSQPKIDFLTQFIRRNDLIRYLIGVDSHPQIIDRCFSIVGFLCHTRSYCNDDTDIIWQTVSESQDTRAVAAILSVFQYNLDTLSPELLCYIAKRLLELPFDRFDIAMLDFSLRLIHLMNHKLVRDLTSNQDEVEINECTIRFCFRMLREANTPTRICSDLSGRMRQQIHSTLSQKMKYMRNQFSPNDGSTSMQYMFVELCEHIRAHSEFASGSTLAIGAVLFDANPNECSRLVHEYDLAGLVIEDILYACNLIRTSGSRDCTELEFENRYQLLTTIVLYANHAITDQLLDQLWSKVLSSSDLDQRVRSMLWHGLGNTFDATRARNNTLDTVVNNYLPILSPALYDLAVFHFVKQSVKYEMRHTPMDLTETQATVTVPGIDRVWDIMLTAPANTVEVSALQFIIEQYLDSDRITRCDSACVEATHLALVDRSVQQVIEAANHLKATPDVSMSGVQTSTQVEDQVLEPGYHETRFHRSLSFLRKFLDDLKARPRFRPTVNQTLKNTLNTFEKQGQLYEVTLQIIGHKSITNAQLKWILGHENTGAEVWQFLSELTGWSQFTIFSGGKRVPIKDDNNKLPEIGIKTGSVMVHKLQGSPESVPSRLARATSPVDNKVMHHFDDLYNLLEMDDQFAKEVFDFLRMFSSQEEVVEKLKSMTTPADQLLPVEKPFKLMYYARALRSCIEDESFSSTPNTDFLTYGVKTILAVLSKLTQIQAELSTRVIIAQNLIDVLILAFRARVPAEVSLNYISNGALFCKDIISLWERAISVSESDPNQMGVAAFVRAPFEALVEGLLHDKRLWSQLAKDDLIQCLERALLLHSVRDVRQETLEVIHGLTGVNSLKLTAKNNASRTPRARFPATAIEISLAHLWEILLVRIHHADSAAATCSEYFEAITSVFSQHSSKLTEGSLVNYIEDWKSLMLGHQHKHQIGLAPRDFFILSHGKLLLLAIKAVQPHGEIVDPKNFIGDLFSSFLFPPLSDDISFDADMDSILQEQCDPILDMHTRWVLYEIILALSRDENSLEGVCQELGSDQIPKDFSLPVYANNDRQTLRSEAGYAGLRNLSNTCYLNSLVSQLFMNVEFRELVMNVNIIDHSKQKLVSELGKVFAYMQNSYEESINPECAIDAITLWDGDQIDVTVQMDVDEFFNLLFDRLESQIVDPKVCSAFKSIYGGQLVQQIKSKECEHVSERLEPFAAVQVEIKGKATLEESLRAYVEGEVLQGENKYSCTGCGKHVDAVKRACLKTVPDHLIFNLKRFDYDIMTGMRCKVNDEFGFPEMIDMTPYTLEALTDPETPSKSDVFELVGVIVHSGTAESGHYYSYIRQRPSYTGREKSWLQFNDNDVTQFDSASIKDCCFGGTDFGAIQCPKFYNGYMLFYQRASSIHEFEQKYPNDSLTGRVRIPTTSDLDLHIFQQNEFFLRTYVAQDPIHAKFIRCLLQQVRSDDKLRCNDSHSDTVSKLLVISLEYLQHVSARWKDQPEVEETLGLICQYANDCEGCAKRIIKWLMRPDHIADNLVRSCYVAVRKWFALLIQKCWFKWAESIESKSQSSGDDQAFEIQHYLNSLQKFFNQVADSWEHVQRYGRSWEQYFGLILSFVNKGSREARAVIQSGLFELSLELVHVHVPAGCSKRLRDKYNPYLAQRERNRIFNHTIVTQLVTDCLPHIDFTLPVVDDRINREVIDNRIGPSSAETYLLGMASNPVVFVWLRKIIFGRSNPHAAMNIVKYFCGYKVFDRVLCEMLKDCLGERHLPNAVASLDPTLTFISCSSRRDIVIELVAEALNSIETTNGQYAKDFLNFVQSLLHASNSEFSAAPGAFKPLIKKHIPDWAPVLLTAPNDIHSDVRNDTLEFLSEILFKEMKDSNGSHQNSPNRSRSDVEICKSLSVSLATFVEGAFINARDASIQAGQASQAHRVAFHCMRYFGESASDEEEVARMTATLNEFQQKSDGIIETTTDADWNASSDLEGISEVDNMSDTSN